MTDREVLAEEVLASSFPTTRFSAGYRVGEVDAALDELAGRVRRGDDATSVARFVATLRFTHGSGHRSYGVSEVDALLDHVVTALQETPSEETPGEATTEDSPSEGFEMADGTGPDPAPPADATLPSAVVEHPDQGLFARLFRRG